MIRHENNLRKKCFIHLEGSIKKANTEIRQYKEQRKQKG